MATATPLEAPIPRPGGERRLYTLGAIAAIAIVFAGFAPTFYLKGVFAGPDLTTLKIVHGFVMTAWFALFLVQVRLVAAGRTMTHRKLGLLGIALAVAVVAVGLGAGIASARAGVTPLPELPPLAFLIMPVAEMVVFATLFTAAIALRRRSAWHKRFMLVASIAMLAPALARMPFIRDGGPPAFFALIDLAILACIAYDWMKNRRVHPAFLVALGVVIAGQAGRVVIMKTPEWIAFATWLVS